MNLPMPPAPALRAISKPVLWILGLEIAVLAGFGALALDVYTHKKLDPLGAVNMWGYRGPVARAKRPREMRVALVGGTRAFGWGMMASAATAPDMFTRIMLVIDRPGTDPAPLVVLNLGRVGNVAADYPHTIEHDAYLQLDYICLYDDLGVSGADAASTGSGVFGMTGYMPILPLALREKGLSLRLGSVIRGYAPGPVTPVQSPLRRAAGLVLETVGTSLMSVDRTVGRWIGSRARSPVPTSYADQLQRAIDVAHQHGRGVVVVVSPAELDEQRRNLRALESIKRRCAASPWCRFVDLGTIPEAWDSTLRLDTWNYGGEATWAIADAITRAVLDLMGYH